MRPHLAHVVTQVVAAADRRRGRGSGIPGGADLDRLVTVLQADHPVPSPETAGEPDRLTALGEVFGLDDLDVRLLGVAAAPDLDANLARALDLLAGYPPGRGTGHVTVGTALELCDLPTASAEARARLAPAAPLRRHGLLTVQGDGVWLARTLQVPDRVVAHLVGDDTVDQVVAEMVTYAGSVDLPEATTIARAIELGVPLSYVRSPVGAPGPAVAAAAFSTLGIRPFVVDLGRRPPDLPTADAVALVAREAGLLGAGLVVLGADDAIQPGPEAAADVRVVTALERAAVPVVAVGQRGWDRAWSRELPLCVEAPHLPGATRARIWEQTLPDVEAEATEWRDLINLRFDPADVVATARYAQLLAAVREEPLEPALVREAARRLGSGDRSLPARSSATLDDLVLPGDVRAQLEQLISWARNREAVLAQGPVHGRGGKGTGLAALFSGGPGTGKTLAAHVVSDALGLDLFQVDLSNVVSKYIGETEKNLERVFQAAERHSVVLFFDEADSLFGSRSEVRDARDRYANLEVSYLLQRMEQYDGIVLLATNLRGNLDSAFSRRLHFIIHFPDPDVPTRRRLWEQHLRPVRPLDDGDPVDLDLLAEHVELAGGDIRNIVLAAAYDAAASGRRVGMRLLVEATLREYRKLGRRSPNGVLTRAVGGAQD